MTRSISTILLVLWPLLVLIASGLVVLGPGWYYGIGWAVLVVLPAALLWWAIRRGESRVRRYCAAAWLVLGLTMAVFGMSNHLSDYRAGMEGSRRVAVESAGFGLARAWEDYRVANSGKVPGTLDELVQAVPVMREMLLPLDGDGVSHGQRIRDLASLKEEPLFTYVGNQAKGHGREGTILFYTRKEVGSSGILVVFRFDNRWVPKTELEKLLAE